MKTRDLKAHLVAGTCGDFEGAAFSNELDVCSFSFAAEEMDSLKLAPPRGANLLAPRFRKRLAPISSSTQAASLKTAECGRGGGATKIVKNLIAVVLLFARSRLRRKKLLRFVDHRRPER